MYYNQRDYNVPYPSASHPYATIKTSGCGVCAMSTVLETFINSMPPAKMAEYSISVGARADTGTDMRVLSKSVSHDYNLQTTLTDDKNALYEHVKSGSIAIANVGGDRKGYKGLFCTTGHYIVVLWNKGKLAVLDPDYYKGKYNINGRDKKVELDYPYIYCNLDDLDKDCENRSPRYYLFSKTYYVQAGAFKSKANAEKLVQKLKSAGFKAIIK